MRIKQNTIFILLFLIISLTPILFINKVHNKVSPSENRQLAQFPTFFDTEGNLNKNIKTNFTNWLNDNIGFREEILKKNAEIQYSIFNTVSHEKVILGQNDWLFYNGENGIAISDYQAYTNFSEEQLETILNNLKKLQLWCKNQNIEFILMLIPNKEQVYSEFLPESISEFSKVKNIDILIEYLKKHSDIKIVYPKQDLLSEKNNYDVYAKYDTHWNDTGAYCGYTSLLNSLNITPLTFSKSSKQTNDGDLSILANLTQVIPEYQEYFFNYSENVETLYDDQAGNLAYQKYYFKDGINQKIFFMGDSFRHALNPMLASTFQYSNFVHRETKIFDEVQKEKPDIFVYQLVERYIPILLNPIIE